MYKVILGIIFLSNWMCDEIILFDVFKNYELKKSASQYI